MTAAVTNRLAVALAALFIAAVAQAPKFDKPTPSNEVANSPGGIDPKQQKY
jgi:hypothetical protein